MDKCIGFKDRFHMEFESALGDLESRVLVSKAGELMYLDEEESFGWLGMSYREGPSKDPNRKTSMIRLHEDADAMEICVEDLVWRTWVGEIPEDSLVKLEKEPFWLDNLKLVKKAAHPNEDMSGGIPGMNYSSVDVKVIKKPKSEDSNTLCVIELRDTVGADGKKTLQVLLKDCLS